MIARLPAGAARRRAHAACGGKGSEGGDSAEEAWTSQTGTGELRSIASSDRWEGKTKRIASLRQSSTLADQSHLSKSIWPKHVNYRRDGWVWFTYVWVFIPMMH